MPTSRIAIKKLLDHVTKRISEDEAKLLSLTDEERDKLIQEIVDLRMRQKDLMDALSGAIE